MACFGDCYVDSPRVVWEDVSSPHSVYQCVDRGRSWRINMLEKNIDTQGEHKLTFVFQCLKGEIEK